MTLRLFFRILISITLFSTCLVAQNAPAPHGVVTGVVYDVTTRVPLGEATLRVANTGKSTLANDEGEFRISVPYGEYKFIFSRVGHLPDTLSITVADSLQSLDAYLQSTAVELPDVHVYERQYDPAQLIIRNAIKRKKNILAMLHDYEFTAYTKLLIYTPDSVGNGPIKYITETQLSGYWEKPDRYKEVITARRQSANLKAEDNLVTIGDILNFNTNRLEIERYKVVSPTAEDAMDFYDYYLLDTLIVDGRRIFHLEMEPKSQTAPLFVGTIDIADSSYAVAGVDVGFNDLFKGSAMRNARYSQKLAPLQDSIWMPTEIRFTGDIKIPISGIPLYHLDYVAALHEYQFNRGLPKHVMNEFTLEVGNNADKIDSIAWNNQTFIPLTTEEEHGYKRIDSIEHAPKPLGKTILTYSLLVPLVLLTQHDLFRYNRVEGAYLGEAATLYDLIPQTTLSLKTGYAFSAKLWEHNYRVTYKLWQQRRLYISTEYHDHLHTAQMIRPNINYDPTVEALFFKSDPYDYFRERGFSFGVGMSILRHTNASITYTNVDQFSVSKHTDYAFFGEDDLFRNNPEIINGTDRSVGFTLRYDNRPIIKNKQKEMRDTPPTYTTIVVSGEFGSPDLHSDFQYHQYRLSIFEKFRLFDWGITTIAPSFGMVEGSPAPQQRFSTPASFIGEITDFKTLDDDTGFGGDHMYSMYVAHDFGRVLFKKLHVPGLRDLPLTFQVFGGAFWFDNKETVPDADTVRIVSRKPYSEIGFGINRIPPFGFGMYFTFQLSDYATNNFSFLIANIFNF